MNRINYAQWTFTDKDIMSGSVAMSNALMFDSLNPDELTVEVVSGDTGKRKVMVQPETTPNPLEWYTTNDNRGYVVMTGDIRQFTYGTPLWYYYDDVLQGKYYVRSVERLSVNHFRINAFSAVGMWASIQDLGGVYDGQTAGSVIDEIINGGTDYLSGYGETDTSNGITFTKNTDGSWTVNGTATDNASVFIYLGSGLPTGMEDGENYWLTIDNGGSPVQARAIAYGGGGSGNRVVRTYSSAVLSVPVGASAFRAIIYVAAGETIENQRVTVSVTRSPKRNFSYAIDNDVAIVPVYGWLPVASVRDNVQQVLFAVGASLMKNSQGDPHIRFLKNLSTIPVGDDRIFIGGQLSYKTPSTSVRVTEHAFYKSSLDVRESLFDNTDGQSGTAENQLVTFDSPHYDLEWNGTAAVGGDNYYYANGNGVLTGKPYTHTTKVSTITTGVVGEPKEAKVENATLVSPLNSANVAARVADYQSTAEEVACGIVMDTDNIKCGSLVAFNDPYGEATSGIVSQMNVTMSGKSKADCTIVKNYIPSHFGSNFKNVAIFTADSDSLTWTVPNNTSIIRIVLGQGGQAGQNGYNGTPSTTIETASSGSTEPGVGGNAGVGGSAGKVYSVDITSPTGTVTFSIGAGGTPNGGAGTNGSSGGHTTANYNGTTYSSNSGSVPPEGYRNILTGVTYSIGGIVGVPGADGGAKGTDQAGTEVRKGGNVTYNGRTWKGGTSGSYITDSNINYDRWAYGGAGGGAAYGSNGENGHDGFVNSSTGRYIGGAGGDGGNALVLAYTPPLGSGGAGGCGGGGGGCPGLSMDDRRTFADGYAYGTDGSGGSYSKGTMGGGGYALVFY